MNNEKKQVTLFDKKILLIFVPSLLFLLGAIAILVTNYVSSEKTVQRKNVERKFLSEASEYADNVSHFCELMSSQNNVVAKMLSVGESDHEAWADYSGSIEEAIPDAYMILITDSKGKCISATVEDSVDLSETSYFTASKYPTCILVDSDEITGVGALVFASPIIRENETIGYVYSYVKQTLFEHLLPNVDYEDQKFFAVLDCEGKMIFTRGESVLVQNEDFFDTLEKAKYKGTNASSVKSNITRGTKQGVEADFGDESRRIITVPLGYNDWTFVEAVNVAYIDKLVEEEIQTAKDMSHNLGISFAITCLVITILALMYKKRSEKVRSQLAQKADTDLLTGLNNKIATERKIQEYIDDHPDQAALFMLFDIDNFKKINDTKGHAFGDLVIKSLGEQLRKEFRSSDIIGRIGGDEFVVFLKNLNGDELIKKESDKLMRFFSQFSVGDYVKYSPTASVGASIYTADGKSFEDLYKKADKALYRAKNGGKNRIVFYNDAYNTEHVEQETDVE